MSVVSPFPQKNCSFECLEDRRLLSITLVGTQLQIVGNDSANTIIVARTTKFPTTKYTVALDSLVLTFKISSIAGFSIAAAGGNDKVTIDSSRGAIAAPRFVDLGSGNDIYNGSGGRDRVAGQAGNDQINGGGSNDTIDGGLGNDSISGGAGDDIITGSVGLDNLVGSDGNDLIFGGSDADGISGGAGNDTIDGDAGDDRINGGDGHDLIQGGDGNDFISGGPQSNYLYGDAGDDTIISSGGGDVLGGDAEDLLPTATHPLPGWIGNDSLSAGSGPDTLLAQRGADTVVGGDSTDLLDARGDDDSMPDRTNDEIRPTEQVFVGTPAVMKTITLTVIVRGQNVLIPASAGNFSGGTSMARVTSVTPQGVATVQFSDLADRTFTLGEFFRTWGISFDRVHLGRQPALSSAPLKMTVNGVANAQFDAYAIVGEENIVVSYG